MFGTPMFCFTFHLFIFYVCMHVGAHMPAHVWESKGMSPFSPSIVGPGVWTQNVGPGSKHFYLLNHLIGPHLVFWLQPVTWGQMWTLLFVCAKDFRLWSTLRSRFLEQGSSCGLDILILLAIQSCCPLETESALAFTTSQACTLASLSSDHIGNDSLG